MILATHGLSLTATAGIGAEMFFIKSNCLGKGVLQLAIIILTIDPEVGEMVDEVTEDLLAVFTVSAGVQYVSVPDGINLLAWH